MYNLFEKIKSYCVALVGWSRSVFRNLRAILDEKHRELEELIRLNNVKNAEAIKNVKEEINTRLYNDELHWCQWSKSICLQARDQNTKFFHQSASQRWRKNHIGGVHDEDGVWKQSDEGIATMADRYFQDLFTTTNPSNMDKVLNVVDRVVTPDMNHMLLQPYTPEEVRRALFQMHPSKSPRPDGMSPFFFQKYWDIVGPDVIEAVLSVLHLSHCLRKMKFTHIVLIPKKEKKKKHKICLITTLLVWKMWYLELYQR